MEKGLTKTELRKVFQYELILLEDTREQKTHIAKYFEEKKVGVARWRLKQGDYSFMIMPNEIIGNDHPLYFGNEFLIERKSGKEDKGGGFSELRNNLTTGHEAFKAEFARMDEVENVFLLIENAKGEGALFNVLPRRLPNDTFKKIFDKFVLNRNKERLELRKKPISILYNPLEESGAVIMKLIFDYLVERFGKSK